MKIRINMYKYVCKGCGYEIIVKDPDIVNNPSPKSPFSNCPDCNAQYPFMRVEEVAV